MGQGENSSILARPLVKSPIVSNADATKYLAWYKLFGWDQRRLLPGTSPSVYVVLTNALPCKIMCVTPRDIVCLREKSGPPLSSLLVIPRSYYNAKVTWHLRR
jgi:hypothetical protein